MSVEIVRNIKERLVAAGVNLSGPCGAFTITKRVAWQLRSQNAGLLSKPTGNNCDGFAVDIVAWPDGRIVDMLIDGGGANEPAWNAGEPVDPGRWRPAIDPGDIPPPPPPPPPPTDLQPILDRLTSLQLQLDRIQLAVTTLAMKPPPPPPSYEGRLFGVKIVLRPV